MAEPAHSFDDSAAYEQFMGRWSRALGHVFLRWVGPPAHARWLDVGCGTGVFTKLVLDTCSPAEVFAVDAAESQIEYARGQDVGKRANFQPADAQALPFPDDTFDVVASALVMNFVLDRRRALSEMRRVARPAGLVAGCVWDFAAELSPSWPVRFAMRQIGASVTRVPGTRVSSLGVFASLFERAGFDEIAAVSIDVSVTFANFDEFWHAQTPRYTPMTKIIEAMTNDDRAKLVEITRAEMPVLPNGSIEYSARANAVKARAPS